MDDEDEDNFESEDVEFNCGREVNERSFGSEVCVSNVRREQRVEENESVR